MQINSPCSPSDLSAPKCIHDDTKNDVEADGGDDDEKGDVEDGHCHEVVEAVHPGHVCGTSMNKDKKDKCMNVGFLRLDVLQKLTTLVSLQGSQSCLRVYDAIQ